VEEEKTSGGSRSAETSINGDKHTFKVMNLKKDSENQITNLEPMVKKGQVLSSIAMFQKE